MDEALIGQPAAQPAPSPSLLTIVGFAFLTFNAAMAVYSSNRGLGAISFVAFCYLDLLMLIYCLRLYERTAPGSPRREDLKVAMWLLTTMLTFAFWPILEYWFLIPENMTETPRLSFQNHTSFPHLHHPYVPSNS